MIADAQFGPGTGGIRPLRFVRRASIPLEAACLVANGIRETLRDLLVESCELAIGEPTAIDAESWSLLARDAFLFLTRGRQTDIVLVLPRRDARALVLRAFGEGDALADAACSALEVHALERIAVRCAATFDPLCVERAGASRAVRPDEVPPCVAYFDVRVHAPLALTLGIGIVRDLPDPGPSSRLPARLLHDVQLHARAVVAEGSLDAAAFARLRPGDVVTLQTSLHDPAVLVAGGCRVAVGSCGARGSRAAFRVGA